MTFEQVVSTCHSTILGVCDGHNGKGAAVSVSSAFVPEFAAHHQSTMAPAGTCLTQFARCRSVLKRSKVLIVNALSPVHAGAEYEDRATELRCAVTRTFTTLADRFELQKKISGVCNSNSEFILKSSSLKKKKIVHKCQSPSRGCLAVYDKHGVIDS